MCTTKEKTPEDIFETVEMISSYSRQQAIRDGVLVDVSEMAREAGIRYPAALTRSVWQRYVRVPAGLEGLQDEQGRLWDILWMLRFGVLPSESNKAELVFKLYVQNRKRAPQSVTLKALCGPGDIGEPVITVMLPEED